MSEDKTIIRQLDTEFVLTEEGKELFKTLADNQTDIVNKFNEIEILLKKSAEIMNSSKAFLNYINITMTQS